MSLLHPDPQGFEVVLPCESGLAISSNEQSRPEAVVLAVCIAVLTVCPLVILLDIHDRAAGPELTVFGRLHFEAQMLLQEGLLVADEAHMSRASFSLEHISVLTINMTRSRSREFRGGKP
jgi:hypothetical protein